MRRLDPYKDSYDDNPLVTYLTPHGLFDDREFNIRSIKNILEL